MPDRPSDPLALPPSRYPASYKLEVNREDLGVQVKFWARLTAVHHRAAVVRALDEAIVQLGTLRDEIALAGVAEEDR